MAAAGREIVDRIFSDVLGALPARERETLVDALTRLVGESGRLSTPVHTDRPVRRRAVRAR